MADRGFDIIDDLPPGVPAFLNGDDQLTLEKESTTRKIASVHGHVHVERAIARIKNYQILHQVIPLTMSQDLDKIWGWVCSYLTLFLPPIINDC